MRLTDAQRRAAWLRALAQAQRQADLFIEQPRANPATQEALL